MLRIVVVVFVSLLLLSTLFLLLWMNATEKAQRRLEWIAPIAVSAVIAFEVSMMLSQIPTV